MFFYHIIPSLGVLIIVRGTTYRAAIHFLQRQIHEAGREGQSWGIFVVNNTAAALCLLSSKCALVVTGARCVVCGARCEQFDSARNKIKSEALG